jgi:hypothetical protein
VGSYLLALACLAAAGLVALAAVFDHRNKQQRENRAESAEWFCAHRGTQCGGASSSRIEAHWEQRERTYEVVVVVLGGAALGSLALGRLRAVRAG